MDGAEIILATGLRTENYVEKFIVGYMTVESVETKQIGNGEECENCRICSVRRMKKYMRLNISEPFFLKKPFPITQDWAKRLFGIKASSNFQNDLKLAIFRFKCMGQSKKQEDLHELLEVIKSSGVKSVNRSETLSMLNDVMVKLHKSNLLEGVKKRANKTEEVKGIAKAKIKISRMPEEITRSIL